MLSYITLICHIYIISNIHQIYNDVIHLTVVIGHILSLIDLECSSQICYYLVSPNLQ